MMYWAVKDLQKSLSLDLIINIIIPNKVFMIPNKVF